MREKDIGTIAHIGYLKEGRLGVFIDRHNKGFALEPAHVLKGSDDPAGQIHFRMVLFPNRSIPNAILGCFAGKLRFLLPISFCGKLVAFPASLQIT
jgi:hypothetical protein